MQDPRQREELHQSVIEQCSALDGTLAVDVGEFVLVQWSETLTLPGLVKAVRDNNEGDNVQILSMKKSGDLYIWPCVCGCGGGVVCCEEPKCCDLEWVNYSERVIPGDVDLTVRGRSARGYSMIFTPE